MAAKKLTLGIGLVSIATRVEKATDEESSGFHAICTGTEEKPHDPARVKGSMSCTVCEISHSSHYGFKQRGREDGDKIIAVTAEELAKAKGAPRTKNIDLAFHPREKVYAGTLSADSVQYLYPDKGGEKAYIGLRDTLRDHPDVVACTIWAPSSVNALWVIEVVDNRLVMSKRCWPEAVRTAQAIPEAEVTDAERAMFVVLMETYLSDFDVLTYVDESKKGLEELVAAKAGGAAPVASAAAPAAPTGDLLAALQASVDAAKPKAVKAVPKKRTPAKKSTTKKAVAKKVAAQKEVA